MTQTYQMKHNAQGTIYSLLTVESDGQMTMTFHGTDREICHEANMTEDGRIAVGSSLFPGLESGRWQLMADVRGLMADVIETADCADSTDNEPEVIAETTNYTNNEPVTVRSALPLCSAKNSKPSDISHHTSAIDQPRPRRQRKPRKPRVERQPSDISHQTLSIDHQPSSIDHQPSDIDRHQPSATMKAIGMVAAATVALFVIYETGLLIPLGLIGLATGGLLK